MKSLETRIARLESLDQPRADGLVIGDKFISHDELTARQQYTGLPFVYIGDKSEYEILGKPSLTEFVKRYKENHNYWDNLLRERTVAL